MATQRSYWQSAFETPFSSSSTQLRLHGCINIDREFPNENKLIVVFEMDYTNQ